MNKILTIPLHKLESISKDTKDREYCIPVNKDTGELLLGGRWSCKHSEFSLPRKPNEPNVVVYIKPFEFRANLYIDRNISGGWISLIHKEEKDINKRTERFCVNHNNLLPFIKHSQNGFIEGIFTIGFTKGHEFTLKFVQP